MNLSARAQKSSGGDPKSRGGGRTFNGLWSSGRFGRGENQYASWEIPVS